MALPKNDRFDLGVVDNSILNTNTSLLIANGEIDIHTNNVLGNIFTPEIQNDSNIGENIDLRFPDNVLNEANLLEEIFQPDNTEISTNEKPLRKVTEFEENEKVSALPDIFINTIPISSNPDTSQVVNPKKISKQQLLFGVGGLLALTIVMVVL